VDRSASIAGQRTLLVTGCDPANTAAVLERHWELGAVVGLAAPQEQERLEAALRPAESPLPQWGPAVVVGSGGSSGGRRWCLQPLRHLEASARATGQWLRAIGIDPAATVQFDPLPLHHVSGLMPLVRARLWTTPLRWLPAEWMRQPAELARLAALPPDRQALLSLVPTQLHRLLAVPEGVAWLRGFAVVWVGGAALPADLAAGARRYGIRLSPCYGATETAAMLAALPPHRFLAGEAGCGPALPDISLRLAGREGALEVRSGRLTPGWFEAGALRPLPAPGGWWRSGDAARLAAGSGPGPGEPALEILGRLDGAVHSGGETVFPDQVAERLRAMVCAQGLPLEALLLLPVPEPPWGDRLVGLFRAARSPAGEVPATDALIQALQALARTLPPSQRPLRWMHCEGLRPSSAGKWERSRWQAWLEAEHQGTPPNP
jgi:O-succinylbenzoic acid--CoA ligase